MGGFDLGAVLRNPHLMNMVNEQQKVLIKKIKQVH